jgi:N-acetylmuramic acid 6-phosphate etherase
MTVFGITLRLMAAERLEELVTESRSDDAGKRDLEPTLGLVRRMNDEDSTVADVVGRAAPVLARLIDDVVERLARGGRLVYVGAGTSGRLAALDAEECESTFSAAPGQVIALVAGARLSSSADRDAAEDDEDAGASELRDLGVSQDDAVIALSASGRTPYVLGAARAAADAGALTAAVVSAPGSALSELTDHEIEVVVGPEFIAGSTRLKAGTAQKLVLNTISTVTMIRLGKTYGDLMVDVAGTNEKLRARAHAAVVQATGASEDEAATALEAADGSAKVAIVSLLAGVDADEARARLAGADDNVRTALEGAEQ